MKISIITVCLNSQDLIERTVQSVVSQDYPDIEYIVIDGGSTDSTLHLLQGYRSKIAVLISEKDNGIYDAMNKGLRHATGELVYFLNSGDYLTRDDTISQIMGFIAKYPHDDIFTGDVWYYDDESAERWSGYRKDKVDLMARVINHQSIISRKLVFDICGHFDTRYRIYADYDWLLRAVIKYGSRVRYSGIPIAYYLKAGKSDRMWRKYLPERQEIVVKYAPAGLIARYLFRYPGDGLRYLANRIQGLFLTDS